MAPAVGVPDNLNIRLSPWKTSRNQKGGLACIPEGAPNVSPISADGQATFGWPNSVSFGVSSISTGTNVSHAQRLRPLQSSRNGPELPLRYNSAKGRKRLGYAL